MHPTVEATSAGEGGGGRDGHRHCYRLRLPAVRGEHAFLDGGHGARREVFATRTFCAGDRGVGVFARLEFVGDPAEVAKARGNHTDAFLESIEGDTADAGREGRVCEGVVTAVDDAFPLAFDWKWSGIGQTDLSRNG